MDGRRDLPIRLLFCAAALALAVPAAAAPDGRHGLAQELGVKGKAERRDVGRFRLRPQRFVFSKENAAGVKFLDCLVFSPTDAVKGKVPMVVYIPGNGEMGDVGRQFRHKGIFEKLTSDEFQRRHPCYLVALSLPKAFNNLIDGLPGRPLPRSGWLWTRCRRRQTAADSPAFYDFLKIASQREGWI